LKSFAFLVLLFTSSITFAQKQGQARIDSLLSFITITKQDTNKAKTLIDLSQSAGALDINAGLKYGEQALALATELKWKKGLAGSLFAIGVIYSNNQDFKRAKEYFEKALVINKEIKAIDKIARTYTYMGNINVQLGNFPLALENFFSALKINESNGDKNGIAADYMGIANVNYETGNTDKVLEYYSLALKFYKELGDKARMAMVLGNMSLIYKDMEEYKEAVNCENQSIKLNEAIGRKIGLAFNYSVLSNIYIAQKKYSEGIGYLMKSYHLSQEAQDKTQIAVNQSEIGDFYKSIAGDSVEEIKIDGDLIPRGKSDRLKKAAYYYQLALAGYEKNGVYNIVYVYKALSETFEELGNYKNALKYFKEYRTGNDSLLSNENKVKFTKLETQRELDLKDKQIKINELELEKKRNERVFFFIGIAFLLLIIIFIFRSFKTQKHTNKLLKVEKRRSDDLLLNILPTEVAEELKNKGSAEAKLYDNVTVMFTDFVNFTKAGELMEPARLIGELDICFKAFDEIINKYQIEKIKTIGDAYLAVSGLPIANANHAADVVMAAIEINEYMRDRVEKFGDETFKVRIGIHSGNVVAGIVGIKKFAYDIWGDTVNIAARMEQNSEPLKINISQTTYELIKDDFDCTYRGDLEAKHKGKLSMYYVESKKI